jgi:hypothetical protein
MENLISTKSTFNKEEILIVSEKLGILVRLNVNDFETDEQCERLALLISKAPEMLEMLKKVIKAMKNEDILFLSEIEQLIKETTEPTE